ncbi:MAG: SDR family NAD(P)-dependent oxidoreductase, partial [Planctomycetaceae bacterium]|nr:SDR family NAD(P)-dependent oxidoreductase [Planctomycetaceae bacterium]
MILDLFRLDGRIALVTGATRGLGQAMAVGLAEAGADIVTVSRRNDGDEVRGMVEAAGRKFWSYTADLGSPTDRVGLMDRIIDTTGRIDILVNNAGITHRHRPEAYPLSEWN